MAFFSRSSTSAAVKIVNPANQIDLSKTAPRKDSVQRQCRNIMIYGFCKFQDKGCVYYHPPAPDAVPQSDSPAPGSLAIDAPVFVPKAAAANRSVPPTSPTISRQSSVPSSSPSPANYQEHETYDPYAHTGNNELPIQGIESPFYDGFPESAYDPEAMANFYPPQPTFVRQPLNYHLYSQPHPSVFAHNYFLSDKLRQELQARSEIIHTAPSPGLNLPDDLQGYHTLVPLEPMGPERRKFGNWYSTVYRAISSVDGMPYVLRRIENFRLMHKDAFTAIETWSKIRHPNIVSVQEAFTTRAFNDNSLVVAYSYHPNSQTLFDAHLKTFHHGRIQLQSTLVPERTIWSYVTQIANAIKSVHDAGQAVRMIDVTKILLTGKNRIRIGSCGIVDVLTYDSHHDIPMLQQEDLNMFGRLIFALCCNSTAVMNSPQKALEILGRQYSTELRDLAFFLIPKPGQHKNIGQIFEMIAGRVWLEMDEAHNAVDRLEGELMSELENGRLVRLLCKFGFINERPEFAREPRWSETGDRYIVKLFRDYVFHQVDEAGNPVVNMSHVLTCLNKLDAGTDERIMLVSRDEQSCLVVSYKEVKLCIESSFSDLARSSSSR